MFGKPKKFKGAPATDAENLKAHANMLDTYPQMGSPDWGKPKAKAVAKAGKAAPTKRTKKMNSRLQDAGLTDADIKRLRG